jgi:hypothetical protein
MQNTTRREYDLQKRKKLFAFPQFAIAHGRFAAVLSQEKREKCVEDKPEGRSPTNHLANLLRPVKPGRRLRVGV